VATIGGQFLAQFRALAAKAENGAGFCGGFEHFRGLVVDHPHIAFFRGGRVATVDQLQHLPLGDDIGAVGEYVHQGQIADLDHQLERPRDQEIAHQHAGGVAPDRIHGGPAPAQAGFVDDVVV